MLTSLITDVKFHSETGEIQCFFVNWILDKKSEKNKYFAPFFRPDVDPIDLQLDYWTADGSSTGPSASGISGVSTGPTSGVSGLASSVSSMSTGKSEILFNSSPLEVHPPRQFLLFVFLA